MVLAARTQVGVMSAISSLLRRVLSFLYSASHGLRERLAYARRTVLSLLYAVCHTSGALMPRRSGRASIASASSFLASFSCSLMFFLLPYCAFTAGSLMSRFFRLFTCTRSSSILPVTRAISSLLPRRRERDLATASLNRCRCSGSAAGLPMLFPVSLPHVLRIHRSMVSGV